MPTPTQDRVVVTADERARLVMFTTTGVASARALRRARILLLAAEHTPDAAVAQAVGCCAATVARVRRRGAEAGVDAALVDRPRPGAVPLLDRAQAAVLVALACTDGPQGHGAWTMPLLADRLVSLGVVERSSDATVRRTLKQTSATPGNVRSGVLRR